MVEASGSRTGGTASDSTPARRARARYGAAGTSRPAPESDTSDAGGSAGGGGFGDAASAADSAERAAELLRRALGYALGTAQPVTPALLDRPTPCARWDLGRLMAHADDSLRALHQGLTEGTVALYPEPGNGTGGPADPMGPAGGGAGGADPAAAFRLRAARLLGVWTRDGPRHRPVAVADAPLTATALALTGAVEIAVHGWDIARATDRTACPVPAPLAARLLPVARHLVPHAEARRPLFGPEVHLAPGAPPGDRLLALLGRDPG
ncbi:TIGR03086 family metal-binding protein [Streptomyces sp. NPDC006784]|uniref:TIGR03086 family metal-binding protein n=1 Tax=Streptomyces sp. NPDC006784 TaxID=3364764 RepID=UPI0036A6BC36